MSEPLPPRVTVTLPDGRTIDGRLHARRQDADGRWWFEVAVEVPAGAVQPVEGEDYDGVPTERTEPRWVLEALRHDAPDSRALVLHAAGCFAAVGRLTQADSSQQAAIFLREKWATACDVCKPSP